MHHQRGVGGKCLSWPVCSISKYRLIETFSHFHFFTWYYFQPLPYVASTPIDSGGVRASAPETSAPSPPLVLAPDSYTTPVQIAR